MIVLSVFATVTVCTPYRNQQIRINVLSDEQRKATVANKYVKHKKKYRETIEQNCLPNTKKSWCRRSNQFQSTALQRFRYHPQQPRDGLRKETDNDPIGVKHFAMLVY